MKYFPILFITLISCSQVDKVDPTEIKVLDFVDPFIGTGFHGHTFPGAVVPHGRVQLSPDTHLLGWDASSGYHHDDTTLYGFSHTHLSGTGIGDLGDILFLPFTGVVGDNKPFASFSHDSEIATPGYYKVDVEPWNIKAELAATLRTGWHRYSYPSNSDARLMIDLSHVLQTNWGHRLIESEISIIDEFTVEGYRLTSGWAAHDPIWFKCVFDQPIKGYKIMVNGQLSEDKTGKGDSAIAYLSFGNVGQPLIANVSISSVDQQGASINMEDIKEPKSFDDVVLAAEKQWRSELSGIMIRTEDRQVMKNFYSALYHTKIAPVTFSDADGRYRGLDQEIHKAKNGKRYTIFSLWDTFRSWYPLMTIIEPERAREWAYNLYNNYLEGGLLPKWPLNANYTGTMVGYPAVSIMADAFAKGFIDSIPDKILDASIASSSWQHDFNEKYRGTRAENVMPRHIKFKEKLGFVPVDKCTESVSYGLEMAYYDWCIARMAKLYGKLNLANEYDKKGKAYQHYFDPELKFMRGKKSDGSWDKDFNPRFSDHMKSEFVEGNSWQWTPFVPHDVKGLADLMGGPAELRIWLDSLFTTSSEIYGENASGDITGLIGQYAHGNEPSHHVPFMYQYTDRPWRTQEVIDTILYHFYQPTPEGIIGNEDCGQMSAWYVLNAMGIYQMAPGEETFTISRPIVDKARIRVGDGWFTIMVLNNSRENKYVKKALFDGILMSDSRFLYREIKPGSILEITMTNEK
ncbi:GH92 family glycosyl hydrolase [Bacteroidota bacterium]